MKLIIVCLSLLLLASHVRGDDKKDKEKANKPQAGVILPVVFSALLLLFDLGYMVHSIYHDPKEGPNHEPEKQINLVACMAENAEYEYRVVFQVGCPTGDFSMKRSYIDFQILGPNDDAMGTPVRFQCEQLPDKIFGEMHCLVGRISPIPSLHGIRASHSDVRGNMIYFYEFYVADLKTDKVIERFIVHDYILNAPKVFRGRKVHHGQQEEDASIFPQLPVPDLTVGEMLVLLSHEIMIVFMSAMTFERHNFYPIDVKSEGSLWRSLQCIVFVSAIALMDLFVIILVLKYFMKRKHQHYMYSSQHFASSLWHHVSVGFLVFLLKVSIMAGVVCFYFGLSMSFGQSLYWLGTVVNVVIIVIGTWACANKMIVLKNCFERRVYESNATSMLGVWLPHEKTVYFDNPGASVSGPMLTNPGVAKSGTESSSGSRVHNGKHKRKCKSSNKLNKKKAGRKRCPGSRSSVKRNKGKAKKK